jgi:PhnB protein
MSANVKIVPEGIVPEGYHTVTPYLTVENAGRLIEFLKHVFDAQEIERIPGPNGTIAHAEVKIGDSMIMMGDAGGEWKPMPGSLYLYVNDTDAAYKRALQEGGAAIMEPADQFYGDRNAGVRDPVGNVWWIATHKEDVPPEEMRRRAAAHMK